MKKQNNISRREFIRYSASGLAAVSTAGLISSCSQLGKPVSGPGQTLSKTGMPLRTLGRTGLRMSILSFGAGSQFCKTEDGKWEPMLERALEMGTNFFDTAPGYQWAASMSSEERLGKILPKYRKRIILSTKIDKRDGDEAMREFERSLKRLKTDYIDVLTIHAYGKAGDLEAVEKGLYKRMLELKEQGAIGFTGFTGMATGKACRELMERFDLDVAMVTLNPTQYGNFFDETVPLARKKNMGIIAFKVMRRLVGVEASAKELLHYCWSRDGVSSALIGYLGTTEPMEENFRIAKEYGTSGRVSIDETELETRLAHLAGPHALCYARPDYNDGMTA